MDMENLLVDLFLLSGSTLDDSACSLPMSKLLHVGDTVLLPCRITDAYDTDIKSQFSLGSKWCPFTNTITRTSRK